MEVETAPTGAAGAAAPPEAATTPLPVSGADALPDTKASPTPATDAHASDGSGGSGASSAPAAGSAATVDALPPLSEADVFVRCVQARAMEVCERGGVAYCGELMQFMQRTVLAGGGMQPAVTALKYAAIKDTRAFSIIMRATAIDAKTAAALAANLDTAMAIISCAPREVPAPRSEDASGSSPATMLVPQMAVHLLYNEPNIPRQDLDHVGVLEQIVARLRGAGDDGAAAPLARSFYMVLATSHDGLVGDTVLGGVSRTIEASKLLIVRDVYATLFDATVARTRAMRTNKYAVVAEAELTEEVAKWVAKSWVWHCGDDAEAWFPREVDVAKAASAAAAKAKAKGKSVAEAYGTAAAKACGLSVERLKIVFGTMQRALHQAVDAMQRDLFCAADGCRNTQTQASGPLGRCGKCRAVKYCSVKCQKAHWASHKEACDTTVKFAAAMAARHAAEAEAASAAAATAPPSEAPKKDGESAPAPPPKVVVLSTEELLRKLASDEPDEKAAAARMVAETKPTKLEELRRAPDYAERYAKVAADVAAARAKQAAAEAKAAEGEGHDHACGCCAAHEREHAATTETLLAKVAALAV